MEDGWVNCGGGENCSPSSHYKSIHGMGSQSDCWWRIKHPFRTTAEGSSGWANERKKIPFLRSVECWFYCFSTDFCLITFQISRKLLSYVSKWGPLWSLFRQTPLLHYDSWRGTHKSNLNCKWFNRSHDLDSKKHSPDRSGKRGWSIPALAKYSIWKCCGMNPWPMAICERKKGG